MRTAGLALALLLTTAGALPGATQGGAIPLRLPLLPPNNWWNVDVSNAPVDPGSASYVNFIGTTTQVHPDFGGDAGGGDVYGFPFIQVDGEQAKVLVDFSPGWPEESDGVGVPFYPIPPEAITQTGWVEGGQPGNVAQGGDRHILMIDTENNHLYELFATFHDGSGWEASSGAFFDLSTNGRRPEGWTSADAAGLAILPGLVRYDEVFGPEEIRHAFRVTVDATNGHVWPASHTAGSTAGALPMGARLRLKASTDISGYAPEIRKIFRAMKTYGLIVADNGSDMYVSGVYDARWNNDVLNPAFHSLEASDFEVIALGWHPAITFVLDVAGTVGSGDAVTATLTAYGPNYAVATGYTGTVQFTATDGAATLPSAYTFTPGDAGTHTFPAAVTFHTPGSHVITVADAGDPTITGSRGVTVGPPTPVGLSATAQTATSIGLSWTASVGAVEYEVQARCSAAGYAPIATVAATTFTHAPAAAGSSCVYRVRAIDSAGRASSPSAPDVATTILFADPSLAPGTTPIKAAHLTQLRQAVNAMRSTGGLAPYTFTGSSSAGATVEALHVDELRAALDEARGELDLPVAPYTDPDLAPGFTKVKAVHVEQLRNGVT